MQKKVYLQKKIFLNISVYFSRSVLDILFNAKPINNYLNLKSEAM